VEWEADNDPTVMEPIYAYERNEAEALLEVATMRRSHLEAAIAVARERETAALAAIAAAAGVERRLSAMLLSAHAELEARRQVVEAGATQILAEARRQAAETIAQARATASLLRGAATALSPMPAAPVRTAIEPAAEPVIDLSQQQWGDDTTGAVVGDSATDAFIRALHERHDDDVADEGEPTRDAFLRSLADALADQRPLGSLAPAV
jgi:hypothetical protein